MIEFIIIAFMRGIQAVCNKRVSNLVEEKQELFAYGAFYQAVAACLSLIYLAITGFWGWNVETLLCAVATAVFLAISLLSELEAIKGAPIAVCSIFATGGLFVPCVVGIFMFNEPMSQQQWLALAIFLVGIYLLGNADKKTERFTAKTIFMLFICFLSNGMVMVVQKYFAMKVQNGNVAMFSFFMFLSSSIMLALCFIMNKKRKTCLPKKTLAYGSALALALFFINVLVTLLAKTMESVILYTISSFIAVAVTAIIGFFVFRERMTKRKMIGLILGAAAIMLSNVK